MGTLCSFKAFHHNAELVESAFAGGFWELDRLEAMLTSWQTTSDVSRINQAAGRVPVRVSPETLTVIQKALSIADLTGGAFDITIGVFRGLWKFDEDNDGAIPNPRQVKERLRLVDWHDVLVDTKDETVKLLRPGQRINVEGIAKGFALDAAVRALRASGVHNFIAQAGGDLFASGRRGGRAWRVGIQDPRAPHGRILFELELENQAYNTTGD
jgi:thiamine biosynthesis lipoprotein